LQAYYPDSLDRDCGLVIILIDQDFVDSCNHFQEVQNRALTLVKKAYNQLSNHCYLAVIVEPLGTYNSKRWNLLSHIVLFAEKFIERELDTGYFREKQVQKQTAEYIEGLVVNEGRFDLANEGFAYKDCIVFYGDVDPPNSQYSCALLFEKNYRDETLIPCPACRSTNIRGNSYPILGVRSWECQNQFCPDRTKYNRGKRYSVASLIKQQAILDPRNHVPQEYLGSWRRDIVEGKLLSDVSEMLVRLYSLYGDMVVIYAMEELKANFY